MVTIPLLILLVLCLSNLSQGNADVCTQPIEPGVCKAHTKSWGYDPAKGSCVRFIYGGCGGNENRFKTKKECKQTCIKKHTKKKN
ncbi:unnamed protein product [Hydatigera taeniaeformis]|uniref:BPTI/Kunitz inhibitor domain-containing protein n=1 Tax=Hydatigena taeniaeformis TaxID=6205 RepID=A0A0R3WNK0_HYDTA|nr:unnamed protein product [Hydatigera taeniaeformis]